MLEYGKQATLSIRNNLLRGRGIFWYSSRDTNDINNRNDGFEIIRQFLSDKVKQNLKPVDTTEHSYILFVDSPKGRAQCRVSADRDVLMGFNGKETHKDINQNANANILDLAGKDMLRQTLKMASFAEYQVFISIGTKAGIKALQVEQNTNTTMGNDLQQVQIIASLFDRLIFDRLITVITGCFYSGFI